MIWKRIFGASPSDDTPFVLYKALVGQARSPAFYLNTAVPDTVEGRFEMVALHVFLVLRRLRADGEQGRALGQRLFDVMFDDMDQTLREMGVGDLSVGKRIKALASSFYGRISAYEAGLGAADSVELEAAIRRNIFGDADVSDAAVAALAAYVRRCDRALDDQPVADIFMGRVSFAVPPEGAGDGAVLAGGSSS
jgi:cytochrome b pre-mRNA-processing protein 3